MSHLPEIQTEATDLARRFKLSSRRSQQLFRLVKAAYKLGQSDALKEARQFVHDRSEDICRGLQQNADDQKALGDKLRSEEEA